MIFKIIILFPIFKVYFEKQVFTCYLNSNKNRDHPGQHGETLSLLKIQKISWARWCVPVIPATQEAEAGELPELRRQRLR